jgi:hypothetical protein
MELFVQAVDQPPAAGGYSPGPTDSGQYGGSTWPPRQGSIPFRNDLEQIAFKTPAPALTAQVNCAYAYAATIHADAWLAEHFQKQDALLESDGPA